MIYRYDQPVDMPIPELYDTGIMNAYLNAVKDQYESGEKEWMNICLNTVILHLLFNKM